MLSAYGYLTKTLQQPFSKGNLNLSAVPVALKGQTPINRIFDKHLKVCVNEAHVIFLLLSSFCTCLSSGKGMLYNQTQSALSRNSDKLFVVKENYCFFLEEGVCLESQFPFSHTGIECLGRRTINISVSVS